MRTLPMAAALAAALGAGPALAQAPQKSATEQEKRTADCSRQAADKGLKGRSRSQFMSNCLKAGQPKPK
jgi:hypothetical protein